MTGGEYSSLPRNGTWRTYATDEGLDLLDLQIEHVAEDQHGYIWFATACNGVLRYDFKNFSHFASKEGLASQNVKAILLDREHRLWFGTWEAGLFWWDGTFFKRPEGDQAVVEGSISFLCQDRQGRLWCAGRKIIGYWQEGRVYNLLPRSDPASQLPGESCWGIAQDQSGRMWFGFSGQDHPARLLCYEDGVLRCVAEQGSFDNFPGGYGYCMAMDGEGRMWFAQGSAYWCPEVDKGQEVQLTLDTCIRKLCTDRDGRVWICTSNGVFYQEGDEFYQFSSESGLAARGVNGMYQDRVGHFWFATWGNGISRYDPSIQRYDEDSGLPHREVVQLLADDCKRLWMGFSTVIPEFPTQQSVGYLEDANFIAPSIDLDHKPQGCMAIAQALDHRLWFGFYEGLFYWDGSRLTPVDQASGFDINLAWPVSALASDESGGILLGYGKGRIRLARYDGQSCQLLVDQELWHSRLIAQILPRKNRQIWFALYNLYGSISADSGLGCLSPDGTLTWYNSTDGLPSNEVEDLLEDHKGNVWVATKGGLCRFDGKRFHTFTTTEGLPTNHILCLYEDDQKNLWLGTSNGPLRYNGRFFQDLSSVQIGPTRAIIQDHNRHFWFAAYNGAVKYIPLDTPPAIGQLKVVADHSVDAEGMLEISSRPVIFEFSGISSRTRPDRMLYTWQLEGWEEEWQGPLRSLRADYADLPPGIYQFKVRAIDQDLNYSDTASLQIRLLPDPRQQAFVEALKQTGGADEFVGKSSALHKVQTDLALVAPTDETVLILGETGTGKGLAARTLHNLSGRREGPFISVNCGNLPRELVESTLFGHERGAFTGAVSRKLGQVELAQNGTLFLDEIGDMPLESQVKLLQLLEERTFERLGGDQTYSAAIRVVAATNRDLQQMVAAGDFRQDLYFRLRVFPIQLPPLRQRGEDIPLLAAFFADRMAAHLGKKLEGISPRAERELMEYGWPGNVRELEYTMKRAVIVCGSAMIQAGDLGLEYSPSEAITASEWISLSQLEKRYILQVLEHTDWVIKGPKGAASILGLPPPTLYGRMRKLGIRRP